MLPKHLQEKICGKNTKAHNFPISLQEQLILKKMKFTIIILDETETEKLKA
jgi:hypothetical protein